MVQDTERIGNLGQETPVAEAGAILTIDLAAIVENWRSLCAEATPAECAAVVKADAYGCGITPVTKALSAAGCRTFFVANLAEGRCVRAASPHAVIYVLSGLLAGTAPAYAAHDLRPVIATIDEARQWSAFCAASGWQGGAGLQVDTGMNRLGLSADELSDLANEGSVERLNLTLLLSHFVASEDPGHGANARQIGLFRELRDLFPNVPASLANSSGIFLGPDAHHDLVRPGAALYGVNPTPAHPNPMRAVVRLDARVLQVREIAAGETVGYGGAWTARRPTQLATLSLGYADGIPRSAGASDLKSGADVLVAGSRCPVIGRISMDLLAVDVTDVTADRRPRPGDYAIVLGDTIGVDELAAHSGTIGYEILTRLGRRYHRIYRKA